MVHAHPIQARRSRAVAAVAAAILLIVGWLGARHEAEVPHVRDQSGHVSHGAGLAEHHTADATDHLHGRALDHHGGGSCALLAICHDPVLAASMPPTTAVVAVASHVVAPAASGAPASGALYRYAPKTSPPAHG